MSNVGRTNDSRRPHRPTDPCRAGRGGLLALSPKITRRDAARNNMPALRRFGNLTNLQRWRESIRHLERRAVIWSGLAVVMDAGRRDVGVI